jgi:type I restriction enzyme R subunit
MADHHEVVFEAEICAYLEAHGWLYSADDTGYDRERALFPADLFAWLKETQPAAYAKALKAAGSKTKFLDVLTTALDKPLEHGGGTLNILRNGVVYIGGGKLKMAQFRPDTSLNATTVEQYAAGALLHRRPAQHRPAVLRQRAAGGDRGAEDGLHAVAG